MEKPLISLAAKMDRFSLSRIGSKKSMKKVFKVFLVAFSIVVAGISLVFVVAWRSPKYYFTAVKSTDSITSFKRYDEFANHARPLIIKDPAKTFVIFGATHTRDPKADEIVLIEKEWSDLNPTIALVEGRLGFLFPGLMDPVSTLGEGGKVAELSRRQQVPIYNWDMSKPELMKELVKTYSAEQVALSQILTPYFSNLRFGKPASPEKFIEEYLKRAIEVGQEQNFQSPKDVDRIWAKYIKSIDWRNVSDEHKLPGFLDDMMATSNDLRNRQLTNVVKELVGKGERVFLICGSSHAACVHPAFSSGKLDLISSN